MKKIFKVIFFVLIVLAGIALLGLYIASHDIPVLNPKGVIGTKERDLIVTCSLLMMIVVIPVFILMTFFAWYYREGNAKAKHAPDWEHNYIAEYCWWGIPFIIIAILAVITWKSSHELNPFRPIESDVKPIRIQVVALQWKWLFIYPEQRIASINLVQFPEKTPINFEITSDAPMNSFWIPDLGGQIYAMPAMRTKLHLMADKPGRFRGVSSNISGEGFAGMAFTAIASSAEDFDKWVHSTLQSQQHLTSMEYARLMEPSTYQPVSVYILEQQDLFDQIIMKYMAPSP